MSSHVPAWKRLGLKLKGPGSESASPSSAGPNARAKPPPQVPNAHQSRVNGSPASALKRKLPSSASTPNAVSAQTPNKKPRRDDQAAANQGTPSSLRKSVSFANDTKDAAKDKSADKKKPKKKKTKKTTDAPGPDFSLEPSLNYIHQWHTARESWKFNKNHQTLLIKYLFDGDKIPSTDTPIFYQYIRDLKGFVRTRLRETAAEIKKKDMEAGAGAFPASLKDKETKQKEYEDAISRFLQDLQQHQQQQQANDKPTNANGKRTLDEVEYVLRVATPAVKQRLLKRIRAEMVLGELSDSEDSTATATTTATTTSSSSASSGQEPRAAATTTRQSDGSQQPAKRRRLRNVRTDIADDDSSSSESDSSDSESEASSSDSEETSDNDEMDTAPDGAAPAESSSSSSSSSSSEAESAAEGESDEESESGSSSSDED